MSDTPLFGADDHVDDVEALLRELDDDDLELVAPPPDVWSGIEASIAEEPDGAAEVVPLSGRRGRMPTRWLAVAAAAILVAAGAVVVISITSDDTAEIASADLRFDADAFDPLGAEASATARLIEDGGGYRIRLDDADLPAPTDEDLELWLISTDDAGEITDVQPVSLVDPAEPGTYAVPDGLDPAEYSIVDISVEPRDGDETHSGRSILRGELDA